MKLCGFIQMHNEVTKGNLDRCLSNVKQYCDEIIIYDDASTDNSVEVARHFTSHIILGKENNWLEERKHKQQIMDYAKRNLRVDWFFWIDCDEILCRRGISFIKDAIDALESKGKTSGSFHQLNLWRGYNWQRLDSYFNTGWFIRLWKNLPNMNFDISTGVHKRMYPLTIGNKNSKVNFRIIHYGFSDYSTIHDKCWNWNFVAEGEKRFQDFFNCTKLEKSWIINESKCRCTLIHPDVFPLENIPKHIVQEPKPFTYTTVEEVKNTIENPEPLKVTDLKYDDVISKINYLSFYHDTGEILI